MERGAVLGRLTWQVAEVVEVVAETARVRSLALRVPAWPGHRPGQHVDIRLTADDEYQAQRSYSVASAPEDSRVAITVEKIEDGEVSPYLVDDVIYRAELDRIMGADRSARVVHTLTRSQPEGWTGYRRRIDRDMLAEVAPPAVENPLAFICGPTRLVESAAEILTGLGYAAARIKTERFGPTGG